MGGFPEEAHLLEAHLWEAPPWKCCRASAGGMQDGLTWRMAGVHLARVGILAENSLGAGKEAAVDLNLVLSPCEPCTETPAAFPPPSSMGTN